MFVSLRIITLPQERVAERNALIVQLREAAADLAAAASTWIAPVLDTAVINAGHIVWRTEFKTEAAALAVTLDPAWSRIAPVLDGAVVNAVGYNVTRSSVRPAGPGIWRALIFRLFPAAFPQAAAELEAATLLLPKYIPAIRSWALSQVSTVEGPKDFTYVWEQEFDSLSGLTGDYMVHPVHWGFVDAWFDAECPNYVVDPHLIQVVGEIQQTIMS